RHPAGGWRWWSWSGWWSGGRWACGVPWIRPPGSQARGRAVALADLGGARDGADDDRRGRVRVDVFDPRLALVRLAVVDLEGVAALDPLVRAAVDREQARL